jgi:hypothetical protein
MKIRNKTLPFFVVKRPNKTKSWFTVYYITKRENNILYSSKAIILGFYSRIGWITSNKDIPVKSIMNTRYISVDELSELYKKKLLITIFEK